ncbi:PRC-barrel domain-containing protein [Epibacterium sp. Ofav1-8]|uniref:PRC-barrel domain-containing protein n=1 Tax=Epibacterium sp. Ofav1-8 TaxID=2917735 RepID=UPI001EF6502B|nr:PRC-barrel domain-containing protein [Epibacterium sp. Ofav1-8]MCG7621790.1 PRC-barrel domain-containing protein [Epibacterium sp. Ofav1-8]
MKNLLISTSLILTMGLPVAAAETSDMFRSEAGPAEFHASSFVGKRIYQTENDALKDVMDGVQDGWSDIGEVNDVILSRDGKAEAVLVDIGGFLGIGENQIAVDMDALKFVRDGNSEAGADGYFLVLNAPTEALETAPSYKMSGTINAHSELSAEGAIQTETDADTASDQVVDQVTGLFEDSGDTPPAVASDELTADELTGASAFDANDEMIGEVADIVMDNSGDVDAVIVDVGGFLGIGAKPVELQLGDVNIEERDGHLRIYTMMTKQQMEEMPSYQG